MGSERDDGAIEMTLTDVLVSLVGPPPDPNVHFHGAGSGADALRIEESGSHS